MIDAVVLGLATVAGIASFFDAFETRRGIVAGVGVEGNPIIVGMFNQKPTLPELLLCNLMMIVPFGILGVTGNPALVGLGIGGLVSRIAAHIYGYKEWSWMIANPTKKLPVAHSILAKIFGVWM